MTKKIPPSLEAFIDASVEADEFETSEELIRATHASLNDPQTQKAMHNVWLIRQLEKADAEGGELTIEEVFGEIRSELNAMKSAK